MVCEWAEGIFPCMHYVEKHGNALRWSHLQGKHGATFSHYYTKHELQYANINECVTLMLITNVLCDTHTTLQQVGIPNPGYFQGDSILNRLWWGIIQPPYIKKTSL